MKRRRVNVYVGSGSPEGVVTGDVFDLYFRKDGSGTTARYVKESGMGTTTGWVANGEAAAAHTHTLADITDEGALAALSTVGTSQIDGDAVTYAKMQNVSAESKLLGRGQGSGAGDVQELTLGTNLTMSGTTLNAAAGSVSISSASIAFTDGDTARRVTIADAAVSATSKIMCCVCRPTTADDSADRGYVYTANVVARASGTFDVLATCLNIGGLDPTENPPNETITLYYQVA
jgi:hypothetical protein